MFHVTRRYADIAWRRYFANTSSIVWPPEVREYNKQFTKTLEMIKKRHDPTVTTVAQGVLEWKRTHNARNINLEVQHWLDRFYLSRIGIRFLIGQRKSLTVTLDLVFIHQSDVALNTLQPHPDYVGIICTRSVCKPSEIKRVITYRLFSPSERS
jgi:pyruvate dehydrogenase kinase 2/3/4